MDKTLKDKEEIKLIYHTYYLDVYRFIISIYSNQDEAEDLTQEVFIRLFKSLSSFKGESHLKTWIFSIARNVTVDHKRKLQRQLLFGDKLFKFIPSKNKSIEDVIEMKEEMNNLYSVLEHLKEEYRLVLLLRAIHEFSIKETSEILGWSESKVKVTYHRAISLMKSKLQLDQESQWMKGV